MIVKIVDNQTEKTTLYFKTDLPIKKVKETIDTVKKIDAYNEDDLYEALELLGVEFIDLDADVVLYW